MLRKRARLDEHTGFTSFPPKDSSEHRAGTSSSKDSTNDRVNKSNWPTIPEEVANPNNNEVLSGNKSNWPTIPEEVANPNNDEVLSGNAIMAL